MIKILGIKNNVAWFFNTEENKEYFYNLEGKMMKDVWSQLMEYQKKEEASNGNKG